MLNAAPGRAHLKPSPAGLVLLGGGARAAYQVGVLKGVASLLRDARRGMDPHLARARNPFPIMVGTSAGAINAAALACRADDFTGAVDQLVRVWEAFRADQVYRSDALGVLRSGARWLSLLSIGWMVRRSLKLRPKSLLDNLPLRDLLDTLIDLDGVERALQRGHLRALAVTASAYGSGRHVTFYQSRHAFPIPGKLQRMSLHARITHDHLMASSAIPFVFPAIPLELDSGAATVVEHFGDGAMRQIAPISPAIHMGAERVLIVGAGQLGSAGTLSDVNPAAYPSLAQIAGHALSTIFLDALATDIERLERLNCVADQLSAEQRHSLRLKRIDALVIAPSQRLDLLARDHAHALPPAVRALLEVLGAHGGSGAALASYLLFEGDYTRRLIELGCADTLARRDEVQAFMFEQEMTPIRADASA
jgi:NTE family protein